MNRERLDIKASCRLEEIDAYDTCGLKPEILKYLKESCEDMKIVHKYALGLILAKRSLLIISPPASGRGSATMIGILQIIDMTIDRLQAIVISPNRKLAEEFFDSLKTFGKHSNLKSAFCTGNMMIDLRSLNVHVIVATCGKLLYLISKRYIDISYLKIVVCDVANKLFKGPVEEEIEKILSYFSRPCIFWFLSPKKNQKVKEKFLSRASNPEIIEILRDERALEEVTFTVKITDSLQEKINFVHGLAYHSVQQVIIFGSDSSELDPLTEKLNDISAVLLSGSFTKNHQMAILKDFHDEVFKVLICESHSSLCRKISTKAAVEVINLNIPKSIEMFLLRIRRSNYKPNDVIYIVDSPENFIALQKLAGHLSLRISYY